MTSTEKERKREKNDSKVRKTLVKRKILVWAK